ncbi:MAG: ATP-binding cassette, subfamily bacterial, partial [Acidimicrobiaceae bacterium]
MPESGRLLRRGLRTIVAMIRLEPGRFAIAIFGATVFAVATVASSWVLGHVTDTVILPRFETGHVRGALVLGGVAAIVGVGLVKAAGIVTRRVFATRANGGVQAQLRRQVVERYQEVPYEFHQRSSTGELLSHAGTDVDAVADVLAPLPFATGVIVIILVSLAWLFATDVYLALVGVVVFPAFIITNAFYERKVEVPAGEAQEELGIVSAIAHESFEGALVVKALGAEQLESDRFRAAAERLRDAKLRVASTRATFEATLDALPTAGIAVLLPLGAWRISSGAISIGNVVSFVSLFTIIVWPLRLIGFVLGEIPRSVAGHDRVARVLAEAR